MKAYRQGVLMVLRHNEQYLVIQRAGQTDKSIWEFPSGGIEEGELPKQTFLREIEEELNLKEYDVENVHETGVMHQYDWPENMSDTIHMGQQLHVIIADIIDMNTFKPDENSIGAIQWVDKEVLTEIIPFDEMKATLRKLFELL